MGTVLHGSATTTEAVRRAIQRSGALAMKHVTSSAITLLLAACRMGDAGTLEPADNQVAADGGVVMREGGLTATVNGQWADEGSQAVQLRYNNAGPAPVAVSLGRLSLHHQLGDAGLWSVSDMTGVDRNDTRTDNDVPPVLHDGQQSPNAPTLTIPPGGGRFLALGFTNFPGEQRIRSGDTVTLDVPMGVRTATVRFRAD